MRDWLPARLWEQSQSIRSLCPITSATQMGTPPRVGDQNGIEPLLAFSISVPKDGLATARADDGLLSHVAPVAGNR